LGIGYGGLVIGDWELGPIPNPQSPIPNPQSPFYNIYILQYNNIKKILKILIILTVIINNNLI